MPRFLRARSSTDLRGRLPRWPFAAGLLHAGSCRRGYHANPTRGLGTVLFQSLAASTTQRPEFEPHDIVAGVLLIMVAAAAMAALAGPMGAANSLKPCAASVPFPDRDAPSCRLPPNLQRPAECLERKWISMVLCRCATHRCGDGCRRSIFHKNCNGLRLGIQLGGAFSMTVSSAATWWQHRHHDHELHSTDGLMRPKARTP